MYPANIPTAVVDRLYETAEHLGRAWSNVQLSDDFGMRMILAALRRMERKGIPVEPDHAARTLHWIWKRNAIRDHWRRVNAENEGRRIPMISLDSLPAETLIEASVELYDGVSDDLWAGRKGREVAEFLQSCGYSRECAWAFVWRATDLEWDDVAFLLHERLGYAATTAQLRQWGSRRFDRMRVLLRTHLNADPGGVSSERHAPGGVPALQ
jgi:hypothetical protein